MTHHADQSRQGDPVTTRRRRTLSVLRRSTADDAVGVGVDAAGPGGRVGGRGALDQPRRGPPRAAAPSCRRMEERALFLLLLLRQPRLRMIYVTSQPVSESIIEYYLGLLPGVIPSHARARLTLHLGRRRVTGSAERETAGAAHGCCARSASLIPNRGPQPPDPVQHHRARAGCRTQPSASRCTARIPALPTSAARPAAAGCSKSSASGARSAPRTCTPSTTSSPACRACGRGGRRSSQAIVKLNEGVSGSGNALVDLHDLPAPGSPDEATAISDARAEHAAGVREAYRSTSTSRRSSSMAASSRNGSPAIALTSPSVQMRALPDGTVELLSTHDQLLGGASGQKYLGCVFPADPATPRPSPSRRW